MPGSRYFAVWDQHRDRVNTNPDYASAVGAAAAAVAALFTHDPALLAVVAAVCALYIAIHHAASPESRQRLTDQYGGADVPWSPPPDTWEGMAPRWDDGIA